MAARSIENARVSWEALWLVPKCVSPEVWFCQLPLPTSYPKWKQASILLSLSRILLAWPALTFHTRNSTPGTTCTFLLESDTTKRIAKIWRTFLWTSGNFMLGLNRKQVHFTKCQISFWLAHQALSPGCNNYFLLRDEGKRLAGLTHYQVKHFWGKESRQRQSWRSLLPTCHLHLDPLWLKSHL